MGATGRNGSVASDSSEIDRIPCPVVSVWSGGVGLVCGMKRGISAQGTRIDITIPDWLIA